MKLLLLLLAKGGLGKLLLSGGSMLLSMAVYATTFGWPYAVGFVLLILVHEMGHFLAARQRGLDVGAPVFIPFVGAWITLKDARLAPETEAYVALAGPLLGSVGAFVCYLLGHAGHGRLFLALAQAGFMINLFNLIPLHPLDGGRLIKVLSPKWLLLGLPLGLALFLWRPSPLLVVLALLAVPQAIAAFRRSTAPHDRLGPADARRYGAQYLGLVAALAIMAFEAHQTLQ